MLIGILGGDAKEESEFKALDDKLNELIETSQCFLFNAAVQSKDPLNETLGCRWASRRGCPIRYFDNIDKILKKSDYCIFIIKEDDLETKQAFMRYKMNYPDKHGSVIKIKK